MNKKILIISPKPTHPTYSGNSKCILSYAIMLKEAGYNVFFLWVADFHCTKEEEELTRKFWKDKLIIFKKNQFHRIMQAYYRLIRFNRIGNYKIDDFYPYGIKNILTKIQKKEHFNCVIVNYISLSKVLTYIFDSKKLIFTHDVFTYRLQHTKSTSFSVTANEEAKALDRADTILAIQDNEAIYFGYLTTKKVVTSYCFFPVHETPFNGGKVLLYLADSNPYNVEAITTFIGTVFINLIQIHPDIKLIIGGRICNMVNNTFRSESIKFLGNVNNLEDFYSCGDIFINPTFHGTGLKIKTFEAMAYGKVLISHPHNTIGIYRRDKAPILLAQSSQDYIGHINLLFGSREKIIKLKNRSIQYIKDLNCIVKSRFIEAIEN